MSPETTLPSLEGQRVRGYRSTKGDSGPGEDSSKPRKLELWERETMIRFDDTFEAQAELYTKSPSMQQKMLRLGLEPFERRGRIMRFWIPRSAVILKRHYHGLRPGIQSQESSQEKVSSIQRLERETIIRFDDSTDDPLAHISTYSPSVEAKLIAFGFDVQGDSLTIPKRDVVVKVGRVGMRLKS